jgi:hypothetical protein
LLLLQRNVAEKAGVGGSTPSLATPVGEAKTHSCNSTRPRPFGGTVKLLIDECLHNSLVELAHAAGHAAHHVNYLGLGSSKDWQLMATIRMQDYTL